MAHPAQDDSLTDGDVADDARRSPIERLEATPEDDLDGILERGDLVHRTLHERLRDLDS